MRGLVCRIRALLASDDGAVSVELVLLMLTLAALAGTLYLIVTSDAVRVAIEGLIDRALSVPL
ncbi:DUF4244 domain-containing protein [Kutzneria chonburiensis]|uniref:DUF4244 domain-containing protein n=1 Tax=Kutzneria chonburiensis TaxID=1483604 RepID=A0ABV6N284_9PSEU|nr:DUF4244 domain-containing protein [Kutzneria chonburiensis]